MSAPRPCPNCGHNEFLVLPTISFDIAKVSSVMGMSAYVSIAGQLECNVAVCTRCSHTSLYTLNAPTMLERVPGASIVRV